MEEIIEILKKIKSDLNEDDLKECKSLVSDGYLDSYDVVLLVSEIKKAYSIALPIEYLNPENFESIEMIWQMVENNMSKD